MYTYIMPDQAAQQLFWNQLQAADNTNWIIILKYYLRVC